MNLLETRGLVKRYSGRVVVDHVSLRVGPAEIVGLLGRNGAGKTTTFRMTIGMVKPDAGTVMFDGMDVTHMPMFKRARRGIGYLAQDPSIFQRLSVEDNLLAVLESMTMSRRQRSLITNPTLLLLDEPFSGVDPIAVESLHHEIRSLRESGISILLTDHNVRETLSITDRSYIIFDGRVLRDGTPRELVNDPLVRKTYLGSRFSTADFED